MKPAGGGYSDKVDADILFFFSDIAIHAEVMRATIDLTAGAKQSVAESATIIQTPNATKYLRLQTNAPAATSLTARLPQRLTLN